MGVKRKTTKEVKLAKRGMEKGDEFFFKNVQK